MQVIVSYDVKRDHTEIKDELRSLGYRDTTAGVFVGTQTPTKLQLPNTTLIKDSASGTDVIYNQVVSVINKHNGGLDRVFCAQLADDFHWNGY